ncbi:hypothetical protein BGZ75_003308 [Mortierella antarctica]|nr:hypothetical protein BGZ75_003308 [Mortierella antarctica]
MGGVLFSLDEEPKEFNEDMYIAMRNRIFELEAKTVNYAPFNRSRKRPVDIMDDYPIHPHSRHGHGHGPSGYHGSHRYGHEDEEGGHYSKRTAYQQPTHPHHAHHGPSNHGPPHENYVYRPVPSFPSWYTPETYLASSHPHSQGPHVRERNSRPQDREREQHRTTKAQPGAPYEHGPPSRPNSPPSTNNAPSQTSSPPGPQASSSSSPSTQRSQPVQPLAIQPRPIQPHSNSEGATQSSFHAHTPHANRHSPTSHPARQYTQSQQEQQPPSSAATQAAHSAAVAAAAAAAQQERQSFHQRQHRAQQRAQSDYSRSYHLQKHMRMMDQQRAAQLAQQKQQQEEQQQQQQQSFKIQRHYQPHQRMYPHPSTSQSTQAQQQQQQPQQQQQQQSLRGAAFHHQQQQAAQQQLIQRYREQQRQLQQKKQQQQVRQLQYLRQRTAAAQAAASVSIFTTPQPASAMGHGNPATPIADKVDRPMRPNPTRPLECSNCMALDSLTWRPKIDIPPSSSSPSSASASDTHASEGSTPTTEGKLLCPACVQYWQAHGKCRPVPPFRTNFLKKIHCRFKKELQEVRFQGWQDAQVIEFDDRMSEREFHAVFKVLPVEDTFGMRSRQTSVSSHHNNSGAPTAASSPVLRSASTTAASGATDSPAANSVAAAPPVATAESAEGPVVIKIEDDDDENVAAPLSGSAPAQASTKGDEEELAFQSEAAVGDLFGHRWKTEPMVGYTLVHFGGSDRTRMVPMNPTVPSLTVMFNATTESVTFTFRVLVNGLCLLSSGGGPPALHMPEMADDEPSEGEEEEEEQALLADAATESQEDESDQPMTEPSHHGQDKSSSPLVTGEPNEAPITTTMDVDVPISV